MVDSLDVCEDFNGLVCIEAPVEISDALPLDWEPVIAGIALSITYVGFDGAEYTHRFLPSAETIKALADIDSADLDNKTAQSIGSAAALLLADPNDDYILINKVSLTNLGLEDQ